MAAIFALSAPAAAIANSIVVTNCNDNNPAPNGSLRAAVANVGERDRGRVLVFTAGEIFSFGFE